MIERDSHRIIGLLRPETGSISAVFEDHEAEYLYGREGNAKKVRDTSDAIREMLEELAQCLDLQPEIHDCQLTGQHPTDIMSGTRKKRVIGADVLALVDPEPRTLAWSLNSASHFPLQTLVIASTDEGRTEQMERIASMMPLIPSITQHFGKYRGAITKFFTLSPQHSPGNFTPADIRLLRQALLFPHHCDAEIYDDRPPIIRTNSSISREHLVEHRTDSGIRDRNSNGETE